MQSRDEQSKFSKKVFLFIYLYICVRHHVNWIRRGKRKENQ